ncbi:anthrax toxin lethal factor-related metalloendopeptidase [Clostridium sp.]|uniref:anthrax toxin lethal factor-related metalloendopeptidase n=1 Tax=Clostridium sp. TaxID=1506 RepID=UPI0039F511D6
MNNKKKVFKRIFIVVSMVSIFFFAAILTEASGIKNGQTIYGNKNVNKEVTQTSSIESSDKLTVMDKLIVLPEEHYDKLEAEKMIDRLKRIPYPILEELLESDVKIILSNTNITGVHEYTHLKGVTPRGWENTGKTWDDVPGAGGKPVVARIGYSNPGEAHGAVNLELHETAHAIDAYVFDNISSSQSYKSIWNKEVYNLFGNDPYFVNYPEEYFAETFAMYYLDEEQNQILKEKAPLTYEFIKNLQS